MENEVDINAQIYCTTLAYYRANGRKDIVFGDKCWISFGDDQQTMIVYDSSTGEIYDIQVAAAVKDLSIEQILKISDDKYFSENGYSRKINWNKLDKQGDFLHELNKLRIKLYGGNTMSIIEDL